MRIVTFAAGVAAGVAVCYFYRDIMKGAVVVGDKLREAQEKVAADIEDKVAEAQAAHAEEAEAAEQGDAEKPQT